MSFLDALREYFTHDTKRRPQPKAKIGNKTATGKSGPLRSPSAQMAWAGNRTAAANKGTRFPTTTNPKRKGSLSDLAQNRTANALQNRTSRVPGAISGGDFGPPDFGIPGAPGFDPADLMAQLDAEYGPQLAALDQLASQKKGAYGKADKDLEAMFGGLSRYMGERGAAIGQNYDKAQADQVAHFTALDQLVAQNYGKTRDELAANRKMLGLEESAAATDPMIAQDQARASSSIQQQGATGNQALEVLQQGTQGVMDLFGAMARGAGANRRGELGSQLMAALNQIDAQKGELSAQKAGQFAELSNQLQQQDFENQMKRYGMEQDAMGSLWDRQFKMQQYEDERNAASMQVPEMGDYLTGASQILAPLGASAGQRGMNSIMEAMNDARVQSGEVKTAYQFANIAVARAKANGIKDNGALSKIQIAALQAFGNKAY